MRGSPFFVAAVFATLHIKMWVGLKKFANVLWSWLFWRRIPTGSLGCCVRTSGDRLFPSLHIQRPGLFDQPVYGSPPNCWVSAVAGALSESSFLTQVKAAKDVYIGDPRAFGHDMERHFVVLNTFIEIDGKGAFIRDGLIPNRP